MLEGCWSIGSAESGSKISYTDLKEQDGTKIDFFTLIPKITEDQQTEDEIAGYECDKRVY